MNLSTPSQLLEAQIFFVAILFTATWTPYEVTFRGSITNVGDPLFIINRVIDLVFAIELVSSFFIMTKIVNTVGVTSEELWQSDIKVIAANYLKGWFSIDIWTLLLPLALDISAIAEDGGSGGSTENLKAVRVLKVLM